MMQRLGLAVLVVLWVVLLGCHRRASEAIAGDAPLPNIVMKDSTEGFLLTWIDEKGNFHVEQKAADVPLVGRDAVRVVDPLQDDGTHPDRIFVADLRAAGPDGAYPVRVSTRAEFDAIAESRRQKNGPTLASSTTAPSSPPSAFAGAAPPLDDHPGTVQPPGAQGRPAVIIYGASWCGACHEAAAYFRKKGISFVEKDIEEDANAAREMRLKLSHAGLHVGSIPVLDVRGHVMIGFNPGEVDAALGEAL
jgi:glutaredoxin